MRPLDEKPLTPATEEQRARLKRVNLSLRWLTVAVYVGAAILAVITWRPWPATLVALGFYFVGAAAVVRLLVHASIGLALSQDLESTEWMRRGGLMASPEANARPDEIRIRTALSKLQPDFPSQAHDAVEAYLGMADDDEKQLCRDRLIREFYDRAGSAKLDLTHRKAYNQLRLALSPWAETNSDSDS